MRVINEAVVRAPVKVGDIIIENILNTGVNIIATRSMDESK
jgi:CxxC motif-containing protein